MKKAFIERKIFSRSRLKLNFVDTLVISGDTKIKKVKVAYEIRSKW